MDNISNQRVRKDGREGNILNKISVVVRWDNGSIYPVKLEDLEFIDILPKADPKDDDIIFNKVR